MGRLLITLIIGGVIGWLASIMMKANGQMGLLKLEGYQAGGSK